MPHFIFEQGNALHSASDRHDAMQIAGEVGAGTGFIDRADIKLRIITFDDFVHLDGRSSFLHLTVRLLAGRTTDQKHNLSDALRTALDARFPQVGSISIEICDMDPDTYLKRLTPPG